MCYLCGRLNHLLKACEDKIDEINEANIKSLPYDTRLCPNPFKEKIVTSY